MQVDEIRRRLAQPPRDGHHATRRPVIARVDRGCLQASAPCLLFAAAPGRAQEQVVVPALAQALHQEEDLHLAAREAALGRDVGDAERVA